MRILSELLRLLSPKERRQLYLLLPLLVLTALLEVVGVASVTPFLAIVADPGAVDRHDALRWLYQAGGFADVRQFLVAVGALMFAFILLSNAMSALSTWAVLRFSWMRSHTIALRILSGYLARPYAFFLERHSADLGKTLLNEVHQVVAGTIVPALKAIAKTIAALAILGLLVAVDPTLAALTALVMGGAYGLIFVAIRKRQHRIGAIRWQANRSRFEVLAETFGGIKELKLLGREPEMMRRFRRASALNAQATASNQLVAQLPRFALEAVAFGGILLMVLYLLGVGEDLQAIVPILGLYALAGYRLMPSLQQIFHGLTSIRFNQTALEQLLADLPPRAASSATPASQPPLRLERSIRLRGITFRYPTAGEPLFRGLDLEIEARSSVAFVGETGSGKSTLADLVLGLLQPDEGTIEIDGEALTGHTLPRWQRNLGYVPQAIFLANDSVRRNIAFGVRDEAIDDAAVLRAARIACIDTFVENELPQGYETVVGERGVRLSGGQRQRLGIARALYHDPQVILFDEATSSLDTVTEEQVMQALANLARDRTVITIAHRLSTVRGCDRIHLLSAGEVIASGRYEELLETIPGFQALVLASGR